LNIKKGRNKRGPCKGREGLRLEQGLSANYL
jgi:hypothetical protein